MNRFDVCLQWVRKFLNSYCFYAFEFFLAVYFIYTRQEVQGVLVFVALISGILLMCDDIVATLLPFLLVCAFATNCYNSFDIFIGYAIYALPVIACVIFHFVFYRKSYSVGYSFKGIFAVSIALCLGGLGGFSLMEYARGSYYVLGLGFGMMIAYILMKSELSVKRKYDIKERFSVIMLLTAIFCFFIIYFGKYYYTKYGIFHEGRFRPAFSSNNLATLLMFAMPFPLYLAKKNPLWAFMLPIIFFGIWYSRSRGGIVFGVIEFCVCVVSWVLNGNRKIRCCIVGVGIIALIVFSIVHWGRIWDEIYYLMEIDTLKKETRSKMFFEAIENFKKNPLLGTGILDDSIAYGEYNVKGTMTWYHMMIPQIIGSMGLVGVVAYAFQCVGRVKLIFTKKNAWSLCLGISYLGIFLMSQVNPGEFCPLPFQFLTVILFILQEERFTKRALWEKNL